MNGDEIAGATLCKTLAGEGWVNAVGVRRPWRKRGLALLRHAFGECMRVRESYAIYLEVLRPGEDLGVRS